MEKEKLIDFIDDFIDVGKEPQPITDPKIKELHDKIMDEYKYNIAEKNR